MPPMLTVLLLVAALGPGWRRAGPRRRRDRHHPGQSPAHADRDPAVPGAATKSAELAAIIADIVAGRSGTLRAVQADRSAPPSSSGSPMSTCRRAFATGASSTPRRWWSARSAKTGGGQIQAQFRLWDVFSGRELRRRGVLHAGESWRRVGHIIADAVYERLTGEKGYFDSRVAFIEEIGPKNKRVKRLAIMDQDGQNLRYLTRRPDSLVLTPRFSPNNREITYTSYEAGQPRGAAAQIWRAAARRWSAIFPA